MHFERVICMYKIHSLLLYSCFFFFCAAGCIQILGPSCRHLGKGYQGLLTIALKGYFLVLILLGFCTVKRLPSQTFSFFS